MLNRAFPVQPTANAEASLSSANYCQRQRGPPVAIVSLSVVIVQQWLRVSTVVPVEIDTLFSDIVEGFASRADAA